MSGFSVFENKRENVDVERTHDKALYSRVNTTNNHQEEQYSLMWHLLHPKA